MPVYCLQQLESNFGLYLGTLQVSFGCFLSLDRESTASWPKAAPSPSEAMGPVHCPEGGLRGPRSIRFPPGSAFRAQPSVWFSFEMDICVVDFRYPQGSVRDPTCGNSGSLVPAILWGTKLLLPANVHLIAGNVPIASSQRPSHWGRMFLFMWYLDRIVGARSCPHPPSKWLLFAIAHIDKNCFYFEDLTTGILRPEKCGFSLMH